MMTIHECIDRMLPQLFFASADLRKIAIDGIVRIIEIEKNHAATHAALNAMSKEISARVKP